MRIGYVFGISLQTELLVLSFFGILYTVFDASLLEFSSNIAKIWKMQMDPSKFSDRIELYTKYITSGVVMVRTFTIHVYLGTYIIMLYPLIFEDRPGLIIPWMVVHVVKCLATNFVCLLSGLYISLVYRWMKPSCWEFLLLNLVCYAPSIYMFCLVLTFHKELQKLMKVHKYIDPVELKARRRRARLLSDREDAFSRSLDGLLTTRKEHEEIPVQPVQIQPSSISPLDENAINIATGSKWEGANVTTYSMRDAAVSGRSFRVSGAALEVFAKNRNTRKDVASEAEGLYEMEELQKISNLDSHATRFKAAACSTLTVQTQVTPDIEAIREMAKKDTAEYSTVSELLNDPNIALVLNMITGKDDPWESDMSKLQDYEITITEEDPLWSYVTYNGNHDKRGSLKVARPNSKAYEANWTRTEMLDAGSQVSSPLFEEIMNSLHDANGDIHEPPQKDTSFITPEAELLVKPPIPEPSLLADDPPKLYPQMEMEGPREHRRMKSQSPSINQIYKNQAAYPRTYKDDGYTQAFFENLARKKQQQS